jgi:hypothetical protein
MTEPTTKVSKRFIFMLDSGIYSVWARTNTNPHRLQLQQQVLDLQKVHKSKKKISEILGVPYGLVLGATNDYIDRKVTLENYADFVIRYGHLFRGGVWNFDVIGSDKKSYDNWLELRRLGVDAIPVHHIGDDESYLKKYLDECQFIGIGAIAKMDVTSRLHGLDHVWKTYLMSDNGEARYRVHGLGLTDSSIVLRYPWYSVDSTRAIMTASHGSILIPNLRKCEPLYDDLFPIMISDQSRKVHLPQRGSAGASNFYFLPQRTQTALSELAATKGFIINPSLEGRVLRTKMASRKSKDPAWVNGLGIDDAIALEPETDASNNLSSSWKARFAFNLSMVDRFVEHWRQHGHPVRVYNVIGGSNIFDTYAVASNSHPVNRALVSFAKMDDLWVGRRKATSPFLTRLECAVRGNTEGHLAVGNQVSSPGNVSEGALRSVEQSSVRRRKDSSVQRRRSHPPPASWRP